MERHETVNLEKKLQFLPLFWRFIGKLLDKIVVLLSLQGYGEDKSLIK